MDKLDLDRPTINSASDGSTLRSESADLIATEIEVLSLWSVQGNHQQDLDEFALTVFADALTAGGMSSMGGLRLLKLWPQRAWLLAHRQSLPAEVAAFDALMTDITHGVCEFRLGGENGWAFLDSYTSVDLALPGDTGCRRCLLGQYPLVLWWDDIGDIRLLIERSYAQSFYDYLAQLMTRWRVTTP